MSSEIAMSPEALRAIRESLEVERVALIQQIEELGHGDGAGLVYDSNFADTSQVTAERGEAANLAQSLREALNELEHSLEKIDDGTYGICENCGRQIAPARLEAKPTAHLCIDCASAT